MLFIIVLAAVVYASGLVAPVYPGSVPAPHEVSEEMKPYLMVYYSRDPIEKVRDFYTNRLGEMKPLSGGKGYFREVMRIKRSGHMDTPVPYELGVSLNTNRPQPLSPENQKKQDEARRKALASGTHYTVHDYFRYLESIMPLLDSKGPVEYEAVCERFSALTWAYFMPTERKDSRGRTMNRAQAMIEDYRKKNPDVQAAGDSAEQMGMRMQQLIQQGRMDEVRALSEQMQAGMRQGLDADESKWDGYVRLLGEIEKEAFLTRITIHKKRDK